MDIISIIGLIAGIYIAFLIFFVWVIRSSANKLRIEILQTDGAIRWIEKQPNQNKVELIKGHRGHGGAAYNVMFTRDSLLPYKKWGLISRKKIMVFDGKTEAINFNPENDKIVEGITRKDFKTILDSNVMHDAGTIKVKQEFGIMGAIIIILLLIVVVLGIINLGGIRV